MEDAIETHVGVAAKSTGLGERINRLQGILDGLEHIENRVDSLGDRLNGPRPEAVEEDSSPPEQSYLSQMDDLMQQMEARIGNIQGTLNGLEELI